MIVRIWHGWTKPDSIDAIRSVAGPDYELAVIPDERRKYLSRQDAKSAHFDVASIHKVLFEVPL